tara:strand:+ start:135 stop:362 length:228 start_codon:yes stop_codon:yes gene_type:complete
MSGRYVSKTSKNTLEIKLIFHGKVSFLNQNQKHPNEKNLNATRKVGKQFKAKNLGQSFDHGKAKIVLLMEAFQLR